MVEEYVFNIMYIKLSYEVINVQIFCSGIVVFFLYDHIFSFEGS